MSGQKILSENFFIAQPNTKSLHSYKPRVTYFGSKNQKDPCSLIQTTFLNIIYRIPTYYRLKESWLKTLNENRSRHWFVREQKRRVGSNITCNRVRPWGRHIFIFNNFSEPNFTMNSLLLFTPDNLECPECIHFP